MNSKRSKSTRLVKEQLLDESFLTHAANAFKMHKIMSSGRLKGTVSLSKYPRFSFDNVGGHIAFHRKALENHLEKKGVSLDRPVYWTMSRSSDTPSEKKTGTGRSDTRFKIHSGKRSKSVDFDTSSYSQYRLTDFYKSLSYNNDPDKPHRFEPIDFAGERELSTKKDIDFEPEHVSHIGHHAILYGDDLNHPKKYALPTQARLNAKEIKQHAYLAAIHNKPLKLSVALGPQHKEQPSFTRDGDHEDIQHYKVLLRDAMHAAWKNDEGSSAEIHQKMLKNYKVDDLVGSMKNSLGSSDDTYLLSKKFLHPSLRKSAYEETEYLRASELISARLSEIKYE